MAEYDNGENNGGREYMKQEEEWDAKGLLDPDWERQQKKVW